MLQEIVQRLDWTQIVIFLLAAVGTALSVRYRAKIAAWRVLWRDVLDGLRQIPDMKADLKGIRFYVAPNGGGSLMDAVARTELSVCELKEQVELVVQTMWVEHDSDDAIGRFHCNEAGENTYVNQVYARWLGVGKNELLGWGFLNFIHPDDVDRVRKYWDLCRAERRQYRIRHKLKAADDDVIDVEVMATPIPEQGAAKRWIGSIRKVDHAPRPSDPS